MRVLGVIEYDGTEFLGFQVQKRGRTVQGELERALYQITGEKVRVIGSGRTDTGVHARGQGIHFDTDWNRALPVLLRALNAVLPNDIAIRSLIMVGQDFSARYSAKSRTYRYTILNQAMRSPLACRYALYVPAPLDEAAMDRAAKCLIGTKDFGAFGTPPSGENSVREMLGATVQRAEASIWIDLEATAFLYRMVRRIVGTLLLVGKHEMSVEEFSHVVAKERRAGEAAPAHGLCLLAVKYDLVTGSS
jgi:tRNA pseudouridine38-40 synthase